MFQSKDSKKKEINWYVRIPKNEKFMFLKQLKFQFISESMRQINNIACKQAFFCYIFIPQRFESCMCQRSSEATVKNLKNFEHAAHLLT